MHRVQPPMDQVPMVERATPLTSQQPWNLAAFEAPLWHVPPAEVIAIAPPPPPPPPPLRLQLIGIVRVSPTPDQTASQSAPHMTTPGAYHAALYDPDSDTTHIVGEGATVGNRTVARVESNRVTLMLGELVQSLVLDTDQPGTTTANRGGAR
jgi:hypothetical protein